MQAHDLTGAGRDGLDGDWAVEHVGEDQGRDDEQADPPIRVAGVLQAPDAVAQVFGVAEEAVVAARASATRAMADSSGAGPQQPTGAGKRFASPGTTHTDPPAQRPSGGTGQGEPAQLGAPGADQGTDAVARQRKQHQQHQPGAEQKPRPGADAKHGEPGAGQPAGGQDAPAEQGDQVASSRGVARRSGRW